MIDEIFSMIFKAATARPGRDLVRNLYTVFMEISMRIFAVMDYLRAEERRKKNDETKRHNTRAD